MIKQLLLLGIFGLCFFALPVQASAVDLYDGVDCGSARDSAVCNDRTGHDPLTGSNGTLAKITNIIAVVGGMAAVIMIIVSALRFIVSGSDISTNSRTDTDVEEARHTITNAVIGLAIIALGRQIILFVLSKT